LFLKEKKGIINGSMIETGMGKVSEEEGIDIKYAVKLLINEKRSPSCPLFFFFCTIISKFYA